MNTEKIRLHHLDHITKLTKCTRKCPDCIAAAYDYVFARMHNGEDRFEKSDEIFSYLENNNIVFDDGYFLGGQGEPSLYSEEETSKFLNQ